MTEETTVSVTLTIVEINTVMQALGNMPYVQVAGLVDKIKSQVTPQLQPPAAE